MDAAHPPAPLEFGRFKVVRHRRELLVDGRAVELGGRAFDTLIALIDARGSIVEKDRLMRRVWPDRVVEENNLQAQISALRKVFGADRDLIRTVAGRGYQFTGDIRDAETAVTPPAGLTNLPSHLPDLIGRDASLDTVVDLITAHRLVTLTGAGGVGKRRLAVEAARQLLLRFPDGVWLVELGPLADPALVPVTVATAVGLPLGTGPATADRVAGALREKHLLLVLDNCEHVIAAAASMAAALVSAVALARVLATTLEPLRAPEEHIYRVPPRAFRRSASTALPPAWAIASTCSPAAAARRCRASRLCVRPSTGATSSCPNLNGSLCAGSPSSPEASPWRRPPPSCRVRTCPRPRCQTASRAWSPGRSCRPMPASSPCSTACSRRRAPTPARSSVRVASWQPSPGAMRSTSGLCSNKATQSWGRGP